MVFQRYCLPGVSKAKSKREINYQCLQDLILFTIKNGLWYLQPGPLMRKITVLITVILGNKLLIKKNKVKKENKEKSDRIKQS